MAKRQILIAAIVCLLAAGAATSRKRNGGSAAAPTAAPAAAPFDYYLLTLSWAPDFCAAPGGNKDPRECGIGRKVGFVVHGLWPQSNTGRGPENCGSSPVSQAIIAKTLSYIPSESLIQHEWKGHGSCTGLTADEYFAKVRQARDSVKIPANFTTLAAPTSENTQQIVDQFAAANPAFPKEAFRATCTNGMLQEARICVDKSLVARACTAGAGSCPAPSMTILPPK
jgi:ribonuclease T2